MKNARNNGLALVALLASLFTFAMLSPKEMKVEAQSGPLVYTALLTQSGENAPTVEVKQNTLGFIPTWTRDSTGLYVVITQNDEFDGAVAFMNQPVQLLSDGNGATIHVDNENSVSLHTGSLSGDPVDSVLVHTFVEIRKY